MSKIKHKKMVIFIVGLLLVVLLIFVGYNIYR